jgi:hypothetical protein
MYKLPYGSGTGLMDWGRTSGIRLRNPLRAILSMGYSIPKATPDTTRATLLQLQTPEVFSLDRARRAYFGAIHRLPEAVCESRESTFPSGPRRASTPLSNFS